MHKGSRRRFMVGAAKASVAASTVWWVAPRLSTVALAQEQVGTPPPEDELERREEVLDGEVSAAPDDLPEAEPPEVAAEEEAPAVQDGQLPVTGSDVRALAVAGGTAIAAGGALLSARRWLVDAPASDGEPRSTD